MKDSWQGRLLVATPVIADGIFALSVVLLISHDGSGAAGLVLTVPGQVPVAELLPAWAPLVPSPKVVFAGYAGRAPGQLEDEVDESAWLLCDAKPDDAFAASPGTLWREVLRRQGGRVAVLATRAPDPGLN